MRRFGIARTTYVAYVLVLLSKEAPDREKVMAAFADISKSIYEFVTGSDDK